MVSRLVLYGGRQTFVHDIFVYVVVELVVVSRKTCFLLRRFLAETKIGIFGNY